MFHYCCSTLLLILEIGMATALSIAMVVVGGTTGVLMVN